jgi:hypothetical protein
MNFPNASEGLSKSRQDARDFGYAKSFEEHLLHFDPMERKRRVAAMLAELENWFIGCEILEDVGRELKQHLGGAEKE